MRRIVFLFGSIKSLVPNKSKVFFTEDFFAITIDNLQTYTFIYIIRIENGDNNIARITYRFEERIGYAIKGFFIMCSEYTKFIVCMNYYMNMNTVVVH